MTQVILQKPYAAGEKNAHGNKAKEYGEPIEREVYGYGPPASTKNPEPGGTQVIEGLDVFAPIFPVDDKDLFVVDGDEYAVVGEAGDWTKGPFGYQPGQVIHLKRVEG